MYIKLKNVGAIKEASVDLTGLTVIAGKNGAGKSTIGKTIYTIIKSIQEQDQIVDKKRKDFVDWACKNIYFSLQSIIARSANKSTYTKSDSELLESLFQLGALEKPLFQYIDEHNLASAIGLVESRLTSIDAFSETIDDETKAKTKELLRVIRDKLLPIDTSEALKESLIAMYQNVFDGQINNLKSHITSEVNFGDFLKYSVSNNSETMPLTARLQIQVADTEIQQKVFQDATLVETPLVLQVENVRDQDNLPHYWKDLLKKIPENANKSALQDDVIKDAVSGISNALGGKLEYNTNRRRFEFIKKEFDEGTNVSVGNMASGEKMFGILQKLALNNMFGPDKITIIDEPENHLHPEWLAVLAEMLVKLAVAKCPILVNSHSPDFLQALRFYAKKYGLSQLKFYLLNSSTLFTEDKTDKEYEIFDNLAKPINDIFSFSVNEALA